jgi:hypothetical protein
MPPVTPIGFTGMIRDPTPTTVSGKIARSFGGGEVTGNPVLQELTSLLLSYEYVGTRITIKNCRGDLPGGQ